MNNPRIEELTEQLLETIRVVAIDRDPKRLDTLLKDLGEYATLHTQLLITLRADRRRLAEQSLLLIDEVEMKEHYVRQVLAGRRRADNAARDAEQCLGRIHGQMWHSVEDELTCKSCYCKMWRSVTFIPCGHAACAGCTYKWFKKAHATHGKPAYRCLCCNSRVEQAPIRAYTVENAVRELPRLDEKDKQLSEDSAKAA
ncbi:hypothetical protein ARMGADRAFT_1036743, partial [Armillaria gallica]